MKRAAPAKINLSLRVLGRRADGFHELETLMVPLALADEVSVESANEFSFACSDPSLPADDSNLAVRAARMFCFRGRHEPNFTLRLEKRVPHGAGLGGGSSDAAATLLLLNDFFAAGHSRGQLAELAAELGSDVPFFLWESPAWCRGRGEIVEPTTLAAGGEVLLIKPPFPVPTPWAYKAWRDSRELPGVPYGPQDSPWGPLVNDLERPVFEKHLLLPAIKRWLLAQPECELAMMSGSGSTMWALLLAGADAAAVAARARGEFGETLWTCATSLRAGKPSNS